MSTEEEVEENIHHAKEPFDKVIAGSMAIIGALLAIVSVLGQHYNTEELLHQAKASDQWAFSQAKDIRRYSAEVARDMLASSSNYKLQHDQIQEQAKDFENESERNGRKASDFHTGEIFLEVAIVFSSLAILMKMRLLFFGGLASAIIGIVISAFAWSI